MSVTSEHPQKVISQQDFRDVTRLRFLITTKYPAEKQGAKASSLSRERYYYLLHGVGTYHATLEEECEGFLRVEVGPRSANQMFSDDFGAGFGTTHVFWAGALFETGGAPSASGASIEPLGCGRARRRAVDVSLSNGYVS